MLPLRVGECLFRNRRQGGAAGTPLARLPPVLLLPPEPFSILFAGPESLWERGREGLWEPESLWEPRS